MMMDMYVQGGVVPNESRLLEDRHTRDIYYIQSVKMFLLLTLGILFSRLNT